MAVDIVIPIYNAYHDLRKCLESVLRYTSLKENRLILINDCSPDERIAPYIDGMRQEHILVCHNKINKGFSGNVNYGFAQSEQNDVLLLNTDTVVTKGWLEKICQCADSDPSIGTVTPLSNSATICSVPEFCKDNPLPEGYTVDSFGELIEKNSLHRYPEITVAVGFCMYIKREVIEKVGDFDAETFQRGYGEENDFCNRAYMMGYRHVLCDDTFVYHSGTASFVPKEKMQLIEAHDVILRDRYPHLMERNDRFCEANPIADISQNIRLRMALDNGRKNVLYLVQRDFRKDSSDCIGGTQLHVKDMKEGLCGQYNIFVMSRDCTFMRLTIYIDSHRFSFKFRIGEAPAVPTFLIPEHRKLYSLILNAFKIDLVHIHHVYQLSMDLFEVAHEMNIPLVATLHDYYYLCPTIKLLDEKNHCCCADSSTTHCQECLLSNSEIQLFTNMRVNYIDNWRSTMHKYLSYCDQLVVPSKKTKEIYSAYFPDLSNRIAPIYHGIDMTDLIEKVSSENIQYDKLLYNIEKRINESSKSISGWALVEGIPAETCKKYICFTSTSGQYLFPVEHCNRPDVAQVFGTQYLKSGFSVEIPSQFFWEETEIRIVLENAGTWYYSNLLEKTSIQNSMPKAKLTVAFVGGISVAKGSQIALEMIKKGPSEVNWMCIGATGDRNLKFLCKSNFYYSHWYSREELPSMLKAMNVDVVCILPIWPETFCYVLSEVVACGIPVIATDIGALGERVREMECGWLVPVDGAAKASLEVIRDIIKDRDAYQKIREHIAKLPIRSVRDMAADYYSVYQPLFRDCIYHEVSMQDILKAEITENGFTDCDQSLMSSLMVAEAELAAIKSSRSYKIAQGIKRINIPFKRHICAIAFKIAKKLKWINA